MILDTMQSTNRSVVRASITRILNIMQKSLIRRCDDEPDQSRLMKRYVNLTGKVPAFLANISTVWRQPMKLFLYNQLNNFKHQDTRAR